MHFDRWWPAQGLPTSRLKHPPSTPLLETHCSVDMPMHAPLPEQHLGLLLEKFGQAGAAAARGAAGLAWL